MHKIIMQLHGGHSGGGSSAEQIKQSAPGSTQAATIDTATEGEREALREKMKKAKGRDFTNKTGGSMATAVQDTMKKMLLGE